MNHLITKGAIAAGLVAIVGMAATPSEARCRGCGAAAAGFVAGAVVGAAATGAYNSPGYYGGGYYGGPGYAYGGYYGGPYAYAPGPAYYGEPVYAAAPSYRTGSCWHITDDTRGYGYYGSCATPQVRPGARTSSTSAR